MPHKLTTQQRQALELIGSSEVTSCVSVDPRGRRIVGVPIPPGMSVEMAEELFRAGQAAAKNVLTTAQHGGRVMFMRPLNNREIREIIARDEEILRHQPKCPECGTDQVQIKFRATPARWKCRMCKAWFTSEPTGYPLTAGDRT